VVIPLTALNGGATGESRGGGRSRGDGRSGNRRGGRNRPNPDTEPAGGRSPEVSPSGSPTASPTGSSPTPSLEQRSDEERPRGRRARGDGSDRPETTGNPENLTEGTVFVVTGSNRRFKVEARPVRLGRQGNGRVEIRSGLRAGERYVVRSGRPLRDGAPVRLSILSEGRGSGRSRGGNRPETGEETRPGGRSEGRSQGRSERP
jgi:hypothetical protein